MWVDVRQGHVRGFIMSPGWVGPKDIRFTLDELHDIIGADELSICHAYIGFLRFVLLTGRSVEDHMRPTVIDTCGRVFGPTIVFSGSLGVDGMGSVSDWECEYLESALELIAYRFDDGVEVDAIVLRMSPTVDETWSSDMSKRVLERIKSKSVGING